MSKRASIDIGSNSILLLLADFSGGKVTILENESNVTGLGRDLDMNKKFIDAAMDDSLAALKDYSERCVKQGVDPGSVVVTATEASRVAENAKVFFNRVLKETGFEIKIISSEAEAYYSATGILFDNKIQDEVITIMDIGGASTELIKVNTETKEIIKSFSMPVGAVRMNNWHAEGKRLENFSKVLNDFSEEFESVLCSKLYCVAGTMTSVGNMYLEHESFVEPEVNGLEFSITELDLMIEKYKDFSVEDFLRTFPFLGKRSKTIRSGLILAKGIMEKLGVSDIFISTYGLRYGTLLEGEIRNDFIE